jgi:C-terminal processing protease CtpA/Prc
MFQNIFRSTLVVLVAAASVLADEPKCSATARECDQLIRQMLSGRRFLGVTIEEQPGGLVIKAITNNSPAERVGLATGDRLIALNDKPLTKSTAKEFKQLYAAAHDGRLRIIIWRRGAYKVFEPRLEPYTKAQIDKIVAAHLAQSHTTTAGAQ